MGSLDLLPGALRRVGSQGRERRQKDEEARAEQTGAGGTRGAKAVRPGEEEEGRKTGERAKEGGREK